MQNELSLNPKKFCSFVNLKKNTCMPSRMTYKNVHATSPSKICDNIANVLESVYVSDSDFHSSDEFLFIK